VEKYIQFKNINIFFVIKKADWVIKKIKYFKISRKSVLMVDNRKEYLRYKDKALEFAKERIEYFNSFYNFEFNRVSIKNQRTRWGSCSVKKNLNFNYKIVKLPQEMADYIIVHELCHLRELNHSSRFWNLVSEKAPNYKEIRKNLIGKNYKLGN